MPDPFAHAYTGTLIRWISGNTAVIQFATGDYAGQTLASRDTETDQPGARGAWWWLASQQRKLLDTAYLTPPAPIAGNTLGIDLAGRPLFDLFLTPVPPLDAFWATYGFSNLPVLIDTSQTIARTYWSPRYDDGAGWNPLLWIWNQS